MPSLLTLIALPIVVMLAVLAPTDCGCRLDLHGGDPLHPVFDHPHPHAPADADGLAASEGGAQLQTAHALVPGGLFLIAGQTIPRPMDLGLLAQPIASLTPSSVQKPSSLSSPPRDPPPRPA